MEKKIYNILNELGIPHGAQGRDYIKTAIEIIREKGRTSFSKELYPIISKEYDTTPDRVERCIRYAIERACDNLGNEFIRKIFGNTISTKSGKLSNTDFIYGVVRYLQIYN